jgi:hypothetical protein
LGAFQTAKNLEAKFEATDLLLETAMSKMKGKRRRNYRKRENCRRKGREGGKSDGATPGKDKEENFEAENEKESWDKAALNDFEESRHVTVKIGRRRMTRELRESMVSIYVRALLLRFFWA